MSTSSLLILSLSAQRGSGASALANGDCYALLGETATTLCRVRAGMTRASAIPATQEVPYDER